MSPPRTRRPTNALAALAPGQGRAGGGRTSPCTGSAGMAAGGKSPTAGLLSGGLGAPYTHPMHHVTLPPELERFAEEAVAAGRFRNVAAVVAAGVSLLQRQEQARADLLASVLAAEEEAEREGCVSGDEMLARVRARLAEKHGAAV